MPTVYGTSCGRSFLNAAPSSRQKATKKMFHCSDGCEASASCHTE